MGHWLKRLSIIAVLAFPVAVLGSRLGLYDFTLGFGIWKYAVFALVATFLLGVLIMLWHRKSNPDSAKSARIAVVLSIVPIVLFATQIYKAKTVPYIHNVSTDVVNPPQFDKVVALRGETSNPLGYDIAALADVQQAAYPMVKTLITEDSPAQAQAKSLQVIQDLGWQLINSNVERGIIEASQTSAMWAFTDDVVIRISDQAGQTAIDLRSVSRVGGSDLGANAKRIEAFLEKYRK